MKKGLIIAAIVFLLLLSFVGGILYGCLRTAKAYRVYNYDIALWQQRVAARQDWELLTNSITLHVKQRGAYLRAALEDSPKYYLIDMPSFSNPSSEKEFLAKIIEKQEELKDFDWGIRHFDGKGVESDVAPEPPSDHTVPESLETRNTESESKDSGDSGSR